MHARRVFVCVFAVLLVVGIRAAPLADTKTKEKRDVSESQPNTDPVQDQEAELESLVSLAGEATKEKDVAVHESHVSHTENVNGQEVKEEQTEQKVTNTKTGEVLADVKQVSETEADENGEPHQVSETKVDIPSKGVHETFVKEEEPLMQEEGEGSIEFTPTVVAKYLRQSGDVENFDAALKDLVSTNVMSKEDAAQYRQQVEAEYERLAAEEEELSNNYLNEDFLDGYYPAYDLAEEKRSNMPPFQPDDLYNYEYEGYPGNDLDLDRQAFVQDALSGEEDDSLSSIIDALLNAWWQKDFEGGNVKAQNLVSYLYDYVSTDANPDDIGQIRDILADMLANALLTDVQDAEAEYSMEQAIADGAEASQEATGEATGAEQEAEVEAASAPAPEAPAAPAAPAEEVVDKDVEELKNMAKSTDTAEENTNKTDAKTEPEESGEKADDKKEEAKEK